MAAVPLPAEAHAVCDLVRDSLFGSAQTTVATREELEAFLQDDVTPERVASRWGKEGAVVLGAYAVDPSGNQTLLGVAAGFPHGQRSFEVHLLFVVPKCFSLGLGSALLAGLEAVAQRQCGCPRMLVDAAQTAAGFYERKGYQRIGTVCHGLATAELVQMSKLLPSGPIAAATEPPPSAAHAFAASQLAVQQAERDANGEDDGVSAGMAAAFMQRALEASAGMSKTYKKEQARIARRRAEFNGLHGLLAEHAAQVSEAFPPPGEETSPIGNGPTEEGGCDLMNVE